IQLCIGWQTEVGARWRDRGRRRLEERRHRRKPDQRFSVMLMRVRAVELLRREKIVDVGNARSHWMSERDALQGSKARERQKISRRLHANVGVEQNIEPRVGDRLSRRVEVVPQHDHLRVSGSTGSRIESKQGNGEAAAVELLDDSAVELRHRMLGLKKFGDEPDFDSLAGALVMRAVRRAPTEVGTPAKVEIGDSFAQVAVVATVITGVENGVARAT